MHYRAREDPEVNERQVYFEHTVKAVKVRLGVAVDHFITDWADNKFAHFSQWTSRKSDAGSCE
jgi:hypothetical protein